MEFTIKHGLKMQTGAKSMRNGKKILLRKSNWPKQTGSVIFWCGNSNILRNGRNS